MFIKEVLWKNDEKNNPSNYDPISGPRFEEKCRKIVKDDEGNKPFKCTTDQSINIMYSNYVLFASEEEEMCEVKTYMEFFRPRINQGIGQEHTWKNPCRRR